ncbi:glycerophosphodiester phosphodiesterase [Streptomyces alboflavus]|uniref:Glycerophosphodiester phosphodiesterase n=1 Tax=Streptomyces alboflavus TaxID=67267 RepID=A0A1Z1WS92_9ACTN|nr:glycerophosphodiester phosphodiesterase family protein [Streptomyces alboflavus]ARX89259.1 glycerophosphodiester phosphodiesterase [Streptomyces alboflavus]
MPPLTILRRVDTSHPGSTSPTPGSSTFPTSGSSTAPTPNSAFRPPSRTTPTRSRSLALLATITVCATALAATPATGATERRAPTDTPADRAHRDFLDHGPGIAVMTAAHRGQWRKAPENSLAALRAAFADGAEIVEADVRLTKDGVPVLMHDATVDRTTDGTGRVADLSYAHLRTLRLRAGLGGRQAALTGHRIPTLAEAMSAARTSGLVNLDQAWKDREAVWRVLTETGTVRNGLFKSAAPVPEVRAFRTRHPDALYMHLVDDTNAASVTEFGTDRPPAFEVVFDDVGDAVADAAFLRGLRSTSRVWINSMRDALAARYTDEASLIAPERGWATLIGVYGASVLQTDNVEALETYLATGVAGAVPSGAVRVQAEDYAPGGEGVGYHDLDAGNRGDGPAGPARASTCATSTAPWPCAGCAARSGSPTRWTCRSPAATRSRSACRPVHTRGHLPRRRRRRHPRRARGRHQHDVPPGLRPPGQPPGAGVDEGTAHPAAVPGHGRVPELEPRPPPAGAGRRLSARHGITHAPETASRTPEDGSIAYRADRVEPDLAEWPAPWDEPVKSRSRGVHTPRAKIRSS